MKKQTWEKEMEAMRPTMRVGDKVRLNNVGLEQCFGSTLGMAALKEKVYVLTAVSQESMTYPEPSFSVEIDDPELNMMILDDYCFDLVSRGTQ